MAYIINKQSQRHAATRAGLCRRQMKKDGGLDFFINKMFVNVAKIEVEISLNGIFLFRFSGASTSDIGMI